jgi:uncharacterized protein YyaL (SSP411 family)
MSAALADYHDRARELAIITPQGGDLDGELSQVVDQGYWSNVAVVKVSEAPEASSQTTFNHLRKLSPWIAEKRALNKRVTAYLCYEGVCEQPTSDPVRLRELLSEREPLLSDQSPAPLSTP